MCDTITQLFFGMVILCSFFFVRKSMTNVLMKEQWMISKKNDIISDTFEWFLCTISSDSIFFIVINFVCTALKRNI